MTVELIPVTGIGEVGKRDVLAELISSAVELRSGDVVVITQKVVSKAEGRIVPLDPDDPDARRMLAEREARRILRRRGDLVITETVHGFVCANAGVDVSNVEPGFATLLPADGDRSARRIRDGIKARLGVEVGVIVSDTFGRAWRNGLTDVAIGCAGIGALLDLRGQADAKGRELHATVVAIADEIAGAAELVMGKTSGIPAAVVRGLDPAWLRPGAAAELVRPPREDLFR